MVCTGTALSLLPKFSFNKSESSREDAGNGKWGITFILGSGIANLYHHTPDHYNTVCPLLSGYSTKEGSPLPPFLWLNSPTHVHNASLLGFAGHTQLVTQTHTHPVGLLCMSVQLVAEDCISNKHKRRTSMPSVGFEDTIPTIERQLGSAEGGS